MFVIKNVEAAVEAAKARLTVQLACERAAPGQNATVGHLTELLVMLEAIGIVKVEPGTAPEPVEAPKPEPVVQAATAETASAGSPAAPAAEVPAGTA